MNYPFVNIYTHRHTDDNNQIELLQADYNQTLNHKSFISIGIHPWQLDDANLNTTLALQQIEKNILFASALGEIGLDKIHSTTFELQKQVFEKQIVISEKACKPLIIHNVHATNEVIELRKTSKVLQPWIIHGFIGNTIMAQQLIREGLYISVGKDIFNNKRLVEAIQSIPLNHLFIETDVSNISIKDVYMEIATLRNINIEKLKETIYLNFKRLFCDD